MKEAVFELGVFLLLASFILTSPPVKAQTPYYGETITEPPQLTNIYPPVPVPGQTPAFTKQEEAFTTQEELLEYISMLDEKSDVLTVRIIGTSQKGRDIPALYFTKEKDISPESFSKKPTVWIQAQIHGNEPGGGEAALVIAERLTGELGKEVLDKVNVIIIPRQNPDGSYAFTRELANGLDGNRDHINLESPELKVIHDEFKRYSPEVMIDAHEYKPYRPNFNRIGWEGIIEYHDVLFLVGTNLNIPEELRTYSIQEFVKPTSQELQAQGFSSANYYTGRTNAGDQIVLVEGVLEARGSLDTFGLHQSVSLLVESRGISIGRQNFARRVASQVAAHENFIKIAAKDAERLKKVIARQRAEVAKKALKTNDEDDQIVLKSMFTITENVPFLFVDIAQGKVIKLPITYYSSIDAVSTLTRNRPIAYFLRPEYINVADRLDIQGIKGFELPVDVELPVEAYNVTIIQHGLSSEGLKVVNVQTKLVNKNITLPEGTLIYPTAQPLGGLLSIALEPESGDSLVSFRYLPAEVGIELPIFRFMLDDRQLYDEIYSRT